MNSNPFFTSKTITIYLTVFSICLVYLMVDNSTIKSWTIAGVEIVGFLYFSFSLNVKWRNLDTKNFIKFLFFTALIIRTIWILCYYCFATIKGIPPFDPNDANSISFHNEAVWVADLIRNGDLKSYFNLMGNNYSDIGYSFYLGCVYFLTFKSVLFARLLKALYSAYICILIYKYSSRVFDKNIARLAAIFCMLMPSLIYYTGCHNKVPELVLLSVLFIERTDNLLRSKKYSFVNIIVPILLIGSFFFFRTVLGFAAIFALFIAITFSLISKINISKVTIFFKYNWLKYVIGLFIVIIVYFIAHRIIVLDIILFYWIFRIKIRNMVSLSVAFTVGYIFVLSMSQMIFVEHFYQPVLPFLLIFLSFGVCKLYSWRNSITKKEIIDSVSF